MTDPSWTSGLPHFQLITSVGEPNYPKFYRGLFFIVFFSKNNELKPLSHIFPEIITVTLFLEAGGR
jgi:hypothetical protein|tara:strand:+ start:23486 stop:23683 length:198 start_codon:yes stop_codon:yes gene_type:complete